MKLEDVCIVDKSHSIKLNHLSKTELIKSIQTDKEDFDCFASA